MREDAKDCRALQRKSAYRFLERKNCFRFLERECRFLDRVIAQLSRERKVKLRFFSLGAFLILGMPFHLESCLSLGVHPFIKSYKYSKEL